MILVKAELKPSDIGAIIQDKKSFVAVLDGGVTGAVCQYKKDEPWYLVKVFDDLESAQEVIQSLVDNDYQAIVKRV